MLFIVYLKKKKKNEIDKNKFIILSCKVTGLKAVKITSLLAILSLPLIGQVTAVYLISKLMLSAIGIFEVSKEKMLLPSPANR